MRDRPPREDAAVVSTDHHYRGTELRNAGEQRTTRIRLCGLEQLADERRIWPIMIDEIARLDRVVLEDHGQEPAARVERRLLGDVVDRGLRAIAIPDRDGVRLLGALGDHDRVGREADRRVLARRRELAYQRARSGVPQLRRAAVVRQSSPTARVEKCASAIAERIAGAVVPELEPAALVADHDPVWRSQRDIARPL